jgi:hypothetical protein
MTATSPGNPIAEVAEGDSRCRVYEEVPGFLTVSFSRSPGMWSGFSAPVEDAHLVADAIKAALTARETEEDIPDGHHEPGRGVQYGHGNTQVNTWST